MALLKGVNSRSGGLSKSSLELLKEIDPKIRLRYRDDGLLVNGNVDNSVLSIIYPDSVNEIEVKDQQTISSETHAKAEHDSEMLQVSKKDLRELVDNMVQERLDSQPKTTLEPSTAQQTQSFDVQGSIDIIKALEPWDYKNREYTLITGEKPVSHGIRNRHKKLSPLQWTDPDTHEVHSLRYASNQPSIFTDRQKGEVIVSHILMKGGVLRVPKENVTLQKFLAIHPDKDKVWKEKDVKADAQKQLKVLELIEDARSLYKSTDFLTLDSIARLMCSDYREDWESAEVRIALLGIIPSNAQKFINLTNDPNLKYKGIGRRSVQTGLITYDNYKFSDMMGKIILEVPRNEDEYEALASYLKSSEGRAFFDYLKTKVE